MKSADFDFELTGFHVPKEPRPLDKHRLLIYSKSSGAITDAMVSDITRHLLPGDVMVFNNSKVIPVSLYLDDSRFVLVCDPQVEGLDSVRVICPFKPNVGETITLPYVEIDLLSHEPGWDVYNAKFRPTGDAASLADILSRYGQFPLPIYIQRQPTSSDEKALQNHYASVAGSIAPPVAGSHFDAKQMERLELHGIVTTMVTLHVGYGTCRSFKTENINDHVMDGESYFADRQAIEIIERARSRGSRIVAVGTTSARVLETMGSRWAEIVESTEDVSGQTEIFIFPPYEPKLVGGLVTNFQYPRLPVIAMAAAFVGLEQLRSVYDHAVKEHYDFYSYGDAQLLLF